MWTENTQQDPRGQWSPSLYRIYPPHGDPDQVVGWMFVAIPKEGTPEFTMLDGTTTLLIEAVDGTMVKLDPRVVVVNLNPRGNSIAYNPRDLVKMPDGQWFPDEDTRKWLATHPAWPAELELVDCPVEGRDEPTEDENGNGGGYEREQGDEGD